MESGEFCHSPQLKENERFPYLEYGTETEPSESFSGPFQHSECPSSIRAVSRPLHKPSPFKWLAVPHVESLSSGANFANVPPQCFLLCSHNLVNRSDMPQGRYLKSGSSGNRMAQRSHEAPQGFKL